MKHILLSSLDYSCYLESPTAHYHVPVGAVYVGKTVHVVLATHLPKQSADDL